MAYVLVRARARRDILAGAQYLEEHSGAELAEHFVEAVHATAAALSQMPGMGAPCGFVKASLRSLRRWPVKDFETWLVFYRAKKDGIDIVRVVHGARDIEVLLG